MQAVDTVVQSPAALEAHDWDEIWTLTEEFFDVERAFVENELRRRQQIALFRSGGALLGMAAIDVLSTRFHGEGVIAISTTHVLIRENWRGRNLIQKLGLRTFLAARLRHPFTPIYWFYDSYSYKSYLLLPRNFRTYWPRHDIATPSYEAALIDELAKQVYGPAWRPDRGIAVRSGQKRMRPTSAPLVLGTDSDPNLRFFAAANPGHAEGDMLICLCPLTLSNMWSLARRALRRSARVSPN